MSIEEKYDEVRQLINIGKEKGYLLYDEVNELLPSEITSSDELDDLFLQTESTQYPALLRLVEEGLRTGADAHGVELALRDLATGEMRRHRYDQVILATGYERTAHRRMLEPLAEYLDGFSVDRCYRLNADERLRAPVFVQGFSQSTHGLSDTLLSVLPIRAAEVATELYRMVEAAGRGDSHRYLPAHAAV